MDSGLSAKPTVEAFTPYEITGKPWGTELVIAETAAYLGKVLTMKAGHRGGLQYHERKDESFYLYKGQATVLYDDHGTGELQHKIMSAGQTFHVPPGAVHQVIAMTDCVFLEVSTPVFEDRVNCSDQYDRIDTGQAR